MFTNRVPPFDVSHGVADGVADGVSYGVSYGVADGDVSMDADECKDCTTNLHTRAKRRREQYNDAGVDTNDRDMKHVTRRHIRYNATPPMPFRDRVAEVRDRIETLAESGERYPWAPELLHVLRGEGAPDRDDDRRARATRLLTGGLWRT